MRQELVKTENIILITRTIVPTIAEFEFEPCRLFFGLNKPTTLRHLSDEEVSASLFGNFYFLKTFVCWRWLEAWAETFEIILLCFNYLLRFLFIAHRLPRRTRICRLTLCYCQFHESQFYIYIYIISLLILCARAHTVK